MSPSLSPRSRNPGAPLGDPASAALSDSAGAPIRMLCEAALAVLFSWTLAYHLIASLQLAAHWIWLPFMLLLSASGWASLKHWRRALLAGPGDLRLLSAALLLGGVLGLLVLIVSRPDADDVQYFHRALLQLRGLGQPFIVTEMIHDVAELPLSSVLTVTSYEFFVAMSADLLGIDPLMAFHNLGAIAASMLFVFAYVLIFGELGLGRMTSIAATALVCAFMLVDGNVHRSLGNVTLVRIWQGKAIMWSLMVPLAMLMSYRYLVLPSLGRFLPVLMVSVAAGGLSSSGLFMVPALTFAVSAAFVLSRGPTRENLGLAFRVNLASTYSGCILAAMMLGWLPTYPLEQLYITWPATWMANLQLVIDSPWTLARNIILLIAVPAVLLPRPFRSFVILLTLVLAALFTNPLTGPVFLKLLQSGAYWRLAYLFPVPLCAGLLVRCFLAVGQGPRERGAELVVGLLAFASIALAYDHSPIAPGPGRSHVWLKQPMEYRFPPAELEFSRTVADQLDGRHLLAPESIVHVLPLLNPNIQLETARAFQTQFAFEIAGRKEEGLRRMAAQYVVTGCRSAPGPAAALKGSVDGGVDAVVLGGCGPKSQLAIRQLLASYGGDWKVARRSGGYTLLLREDEKAPKRVPGR
ncbi:MAG: hypothetical protein JRH01_10330 [Deltaproteobacteria bacterium]|nr:hypothetical protein [Deltaproteobacteria bacterium]MBW2393443.1 hypothetical protein [Deltaproteobacteria bacterium]